MLPLIYVASLLCAGVLSKSGLLSPYIAGAVGLGIGSYLNLDYNLCLFFIVSLYLTSSLGNAFPEADSQGMDLSIVMEGDKGSAAACFALKGMALLIAALLPIPKPPAQITGLAAITFISVLQALNKTDNEDASADLIMTALQTTILGACLIFVNRYSHAVIISPALIAAIVVPNLLTGGANKVSYKDKLDYRLKRQNIGILTMFWALILTWLVPGFSSSSVSNSLFRPSHTIPAAALIEGATEGYVVSLLLRSDISGKTPLGDVLSTFSIQYGEFLAPGSLKLLIALAVLGAFTFSMLCPRISLDKSLLAFTQATLLCTQGFATLSVYFLPLILSGFLIAFLRSWIAPRGTSQALTLQVPTLL